MQWKQYSSSHSSQWHITSGALYMLQTGHSNAGSIIPGAVCYSQPAILPIQQTKGIPWINHLEVKNCEPMASLAYL